MLKKLTLTNFRNYSGLDLEFDRQPTVLLGNNAVGKSNLLEAIYLLSTARSFRVETKEELVKKGQSFCRVEGEIKEDEGSKELAVVFAQSEEEGIFRKQVLVNGVPKRVVDFLGNLPTVVFYPPDINMVTGSPALRRWYVDLALTQIDSAYKRALTLYEQFLIARNRVLKKIREGQGEVGELDYWTKGLLENAKIVKDKRSYFFDFMDNLNQVLGNFKFVYQLSEISEQRLREVNGREVAAAATLIGPHRDDFSVLLDERDLARFGSRGEQRTATLAFKLAQLEYMSHVLGKRPILLLDDVFSELDAEHRAHVAEIVGKQQTIIATVELEHLPQDFLSAARILKVEDGKIGT